jgi:HlyD family secretion protein
MVEATGTLEAVTTVQVGSQVSGTISALHADFNSEVRKGQIVAELDSSLFQRRRSVSRRLLACSSASIRRGRLQRSIRSRAAIRVVLP